MARVDCPMDSPARETWVCWLHHGKHSHSGFCVAAVV